MADVITNLCSRRAKVFRARKAYDEESGKKLSELEAARNDFANERAERLSQYDAELDACGRAMAKLNIAAQGCLCHVCNGEGVVKTGDGPDGPTQETCGACMGTGIELG